MSCVQGVTHHQYHLAIKTYQNLLLLNSFKPRQFVLIRNISFFINIRTLVWTIQYDGAERCRQMTTLVNPSSKWFCLWNVLADNIQFIANHKKSLKNNSNQSFIIKKFNPLFPENASQLMGAKFKNSLGNINESIYPSGWTSLCNIHRGAGKSKQNSKTFPNEIAFNFPDMYESLLNE